MRIPKTKEEAAKIARDLTTELGDYLDGTPDHEFDGQAFVKRVNQHARTDWVGTIVVALIAITLWEGFFFALNWFWQ